jgi:hypothetical protein
MNISAIKFTSGGRVSLEHADDALAMEASTSEQQRLGLSVSPGDDWDSRVPMGTGKSPDAVIRHVVRHHQHGSCFAII